MGEGGTAGSRPAAAAGPAVSAQAGSWAQADGGAEYLLRHRVRSAHGLPVEDPAPRVWQRQRRASAFSELAEGRVLSQVMASGVGRIRRDGGHRLGVAKYRQGHRKSATPLKGLPGSGAGKEWEPRLFCLATNQWKLLMIMVGERGFEPPTPWSRTRCSTRLSHSPNLDCGSASLGRGLSRLSPLKCACTSVAESRVLRGRRRGSEAS